MIVSPDYGPMAGLSVALVNRAYGQALRSFRALALGFPLAALAALLLTLAGRGLGRIPAAYLAGQRPLTGLLIGANLGAFLVAFVAGAAGIIALGRAKSGAVVGVLVSITTIPAASNVGVALAMGTRPRRPGPCRSCSSTLQACWPGGGDAARDQAVGTADRGGTGDLPTQARPLAWASFAGPSDGAPGERPGDG